MISAIRIGQSPAGGVRLRLAGLKRPQVKGQLLLLDGRSVGNVLSDFVDVNDQAGIDQFYAGASFTELDDGSFVMTPYTVAAQADADELARTDAQKAFEARLHGLWKR